MKHVRPRRSARSVHLLVVLFVGLALAAAVGAAVAAAAPGTRSARTPARQAHSTAALSAPRPVPRVAHSTTGPTPPASVRFTGRPAKGASVAGAPGEHVIVGVPAYKWRDGCEQYAYVKLDGKMPVTASNADGAAHTGSFTLVLSPSDAHSGVAETCYALDGRVYKVGTSVQVNGKGAHTVRFYSKDLAGNVEAATTARIVIE